MQPSISRLAVVVLVLASPVVAGAQEPADSVPKLQPPYLQAVLVEMSYSKLARWNAGASLFLSHDDVGNSEGGAGLIVGGRVGAGGMEVWGGMAVNRAFRTVPQVRLKADPTPHEPQARFLDALRSTCE